MGFTFYLQYALWIPTILFRIHTHHVCQKGLNVIIQNKMNTVISMSMPIKPTNLVHLWFCKKVSGHDPIAILALTSSVTC